MPERFIPTASRLFLLAVYWCLGTVSLAAPVEIVLQSSQEQEVLGLVYSPDGRTLVSSGESEAIRVWDAETGELVRLLPGHPERVRGLANEPRWPINCIFKHRRLR